MQTRARAIAAMIPSGSFFCEVGSDHATISVLALKEDESRKAQLIDNKKGPYSNSLKAILTNNLEARAYASLGDGLNKLDENVDTIVLAGLGGGLASSILLKGKEKLEHVEYLLIEPQSQRDLLLKTLVELEYHHIDFKMVEEGSHIYECFLLRKGKEKDLDELEAFYGPLFTKGEDLFIKREKKRLEALNRILEGGNVKSHTKQKEVELISKALERMNHETKGSN